MRNVSAGSNNMTEAGRKQNSSRVKTKEIPLIWGLASLCFYNRVTDYFICSISFKKGNAFRLTILLPLWWFHIFRVQPWDEVVDTPDICSTHGPVSIQSTESIPLPNKTMMTPYYRSFTESAWTSSSQTGWTPVPQRSGWPISISNIPILQNTFSGSESHKTGSVS